MGERGQGERESSEVTEGEKIREEYGKGRKGKERWREAGSGAGWLSEEVGI